MRTMNLETVRAIETAAGWHRVRPGTLEEIGADLFGSPQPVFAFVDDETES